VNDGSRTTRWSGCGTRSTSMRCLRTYPETIPPSRCGPCTARVTRTRLLVIDKENGGKADSSTPPSMRAGSAGIAVDADTLIEPDAVCASPGRSCSVARSRP